MEAEINGIRYYKGNSLADLPPGMSPKTYDCGRGTGNTTLDCDIKTIRIPVEVSTIFMQKVMELAGSLRTRCVEVPDAIVMEYHLTCILEPKPVFDKRMQDEESKHPT